MSEQNEELYYKGIDAGNEGRILTSTLWNQEGTIYVDGDQTALTGYTYNQYCPILENSNDEDGESRCVTGCTNTTYSSIMYYWIEKGYNLELSVNSNDFFFLESKGESEEDAIFLSDTSQEGEATISVLNNALNSGKRIGNGDFIAALNFYCGVKNHSIYGESTGTYWWAANDYKGEYNLFAFAAAGFDSYYSLCNTEESGDYFNGTELTELTYSIIRENLDYGEVIAVSIPGHSIYLDGYRFNSATNEYEYHLNYGWGPGAEATRWYTTAEMNAAEDDDGVEVMNLGIDITPDLKVLVSNDKNIYWGGSILRGVERINHAQVSKKTDFAFDAAVNGADIDLDEGLSFTSDVDLNFVNWNADVCFSTGQGIASEEGGLDFVNMTGSIIVNNGTNSEYAIKTTGSDTVNITLNGGAIFAGYSANGNDYLRNTLATFKSEGYSAITDFTATIKGAAIYAADGDDIVTLNDNAVVMGDLYFGGGSNTLNIESGSVLIGNFGQSSGTLTVNMTTTPGGSNPYIVFTGSSAEFVKQTGGILNVTVDISKSADVYYLLETVSASELSAFMVRINNSFLLGSGLTSQDGVFLRYEGNRLALGFKDVTPPTISDITPSIAGITNKDVTVTAKFSDDTAVVSKQYRIGENGSWIDYTNGVTVTENTTIYFRASDAEGNMSEVQYDVTNIDKTAPVVSAITLSNPEITNKNIMISAEFSDNVALASKQYKVGADDTWKSYTGEIRLIANSTVFFKAVDTAGNETVTEYQVTNIDKSVPSINNIKTDVLPGSKTAGDVTVTAEFSDNIELTERLYSLDGGASWLAYENGVVVSENTTILFKAVDAAGNIREKSFAVDCIDKNVPVITVSLSTTELTNKNVIVSAVFTDDEALVSQQYRIGEDGSWIDYPADGVSLADNATVFFKAVDTAGNTVIESIDVANIDKVVPEFSEIVQDVTEPTAGKITLTVSASDENLQKLEYRIGDGEWQSYENGVVVNENCTVCFKATDKAGNVTEMCHEVKNYDPELADIYNITTDIDGFTSGNVTVTAEYNTAILQYKLGENAEWMVYENGVTVSENAVIYFRGLNSQNEIRVEKSFSVDNIDKVAPEITAITPSTSDWTNGAVTLSITCVENNLQGFEYRIGDGEWQSCGSSVDIDANATVCFKATDKAGNTSELCYDVTNIDKTAPVIANIKQNITEQTFQTVTVSAEFSDDVELAKVEYRIGDGEWQLYNGGASLTESGTVCFKATDKAGNTTEICHDVTNILSRKLADGDTLYVNNGMSVDNIELYDRGTMVVQNQGTAVKTTVYSGGALHLYSGGVTSDTTILKDGYFGIGGGAVAYGNTVKQAGELTVWAGGKVVDNTISEYGAIILSSGASAENTVINATGGLHVYSGAAASNTTVKKDGFLGIGKGATAYNTTVDYAGELTVWGGGKVVNNTINTWGAIILSSGATAENTLVNANGGLHVYSGAAASNTTVKKDGFLGIGKGAAAYNTTVDYAGELTVWGGGKVVNNTINTWGAIILSSGAAADGTVVNANGGLHVYSGAAASNTTVKKDGFLGIGKGATAYNTTVDYAGELTVWGGGKVVNNTINTWGAIILSSGAAAMNTTVLENGGLHVYAGASALDTTLMDGASIGIGTNGMINSIEAEYGSELTFYKGALLKGNNTFAGTITVLGEVNAAGAIISMDITCRDSNDSMIISDLGKFVSVSGYTIQTAEDQAFGTYRLADGAAAFNSSIMLYAEDAKVGRLQVGTSLEVNGKSYTLFRDNDSLGLEIAQSDRQRMPESLVYKDNAYDRGIAEFNDMLDDSKFKGYLA